MSDEEEDITTSRAAKRQTTGNSHNTVNTNGNHAKRLRLRYPTCENCDEEFDVLANDKWACRFHPGALSFRASLPRALKFQIKSAID